VVYYYQLSGRKIANLVYIPQQAPVEEGKTTPIIGTFDIIHKSGETLSVNSVAYDAGGREVFSGSMPLSDTELKMSDTLGFGFDMSTAKEGDFTFQVSLTDSKGRQSSKLEGAFKVTDSTNHGRRVQSDVLTGVPRAVLYRSMTASLTTPFFRISRYITV
jgi:hypothetical protein